MSTNLSNAKEMMVTSWELEGSGVKRQDRC